MRLSLPIQAGESSRDLIKPVSMARLIAAPMAASIRDWVGEKNPIMLSDTFRASTMWA
jgi:hypothetical protein